LTGKGQSSIKLPMDTDKVPFISALRTFSILKEYFVRGRRHLALGVLSLLLVDLLQMLIPLVIKKAVDALTLGTATRALLVRQGMIIVVIALFIAMLRYLWRHLLLGLSRKVEEGLRNKLYRHLQTLPQSFYNRTKTGDIMARAVNDINAIRMATGMGLVALTDGLVIGIAAVGFMLYISPLLTLISLVPAPLIILLTRLLTRRMSTGHEMVQKAFSDLTERVREAFSGIMIVKAYAREGWQYERVKERGEECVSRNIELAQTMAVFFPMMAVFPNLGMAIVIWMGGRLTILGSITTGDFVAFISYLNLLVWPMMAIGWVTTLIQRGAASMRRINRILDERPEVLDPPSSPGNVKIEGKIEIKGLSFKYPGQSVYALRDINLRIERGETVALVGTVGSGKTTLLQVIPRLLDVPRGAVFIDGMDVRGIPLKVLRENIGFVTQDAILFSDTIRNNVVFGREGVSEEVLLETLEAAQVRGEVMALEKGLDSILGEGGITLSGGQRQRLTIARALITDPPILILDDAFSMVDTTTEARILEKILEMRKDRTNLVVSHRVPTIERADRILVLKDARLVEEGDHRTLLEKGREYRRIYQRQVLTRELGIEMSTQG